jgi:hypothetical protein
MAFFKSNAGETSSGNKAPLEAIRQKLRALQAGGEATTAPQSPTQVGGDGTVGNDGPLPADKKAQVEREEALVRSVLALFGIAYDELITSDVGAGGETSPYAAAVKQNPQLMQQVLAAESPVLAALQIAASYKPYAEFSQKYGTAPDDIKANILKEVQAGAGAQTEPTAKRYGPVFSGSYGAAAAAPAKPKKGDLKTLFGR